MAIRMILGKKVGMTQVFSPEGKVTPVTAIEAGPCIVVQQKTAEKDHYTAVQFGFDLKRKRAVKKPEAGHWKRTNADPRRYVRELRAPAADIAGYTVGAEVLCDVFKLGDFVDVIGTSKGAGFAGGMKRHHFSGAVASHGAKEVKRHGGALGGHTFPGRTIAGMRMPGHKGAAKATVRNLEVMLVVPKENLLYLKGAVPGPPNGYLTITTAKTRKPRPPQVAKPKVEKKPEKQLAKGQEKKGGGGGAKK